MNWLKKMMLGRYGNDQLSIALLILYMVLSFSSQITRWNILMLLSFVPLILCFYRMLSRNISKRYIENQQFLKWWGPVKAWLSRIAHKIQTRFRKFSGRRKGMKTHRYYKCPNCSNTLRVPKGRGKISITCPVCKTSFIKKT